MFDTGTDLAGARVLIVDDDPTFRDFVGAGLLEHGVSCHAVANGQAAHAALSGEFRDPDAILLDIMMPGSSGWEVLEQIRLRNREVPVIFVTAREAVGERVRGLRMGADDYIIKPFAFVELLARIETVLRRRQAAVIRYGNMRIHTVERECLIGDRPLNLTPRELEVLQELAKTGSSVSRADLLERVWHTEIDPGTNVVEVHIARLRRKLSMAGGPAIVTERGKGYALGTPR